MARIFKYFLVSFFLFVFSSSSSFAQGSTPPPHGPELLLPFPSYFINDQAVFADPSLWRKKNLVEPGGAPLRIDGNTKYVDVTFTGLRGKANYYLCGMANQEACRDEDDDDYQRESVGKKFTSDAEGTIKIRVCGGGKTWLKGHSLISTDKVKETCDDKDFFHEGHTYRLGVFEDKKHKDQIIVAEFFVKHSFPLVKIAPSSGTQLHPNYPINIMLWGRRSGNNEQNNYQLVLQGTNNDYKKEHCVTTEKNSGETVGVNTQFVSEDGTTPNQPEHIFKGIGWAVPERENPKTQKFGRGPDENSGIGTGAYVLKINERISDSRPLGILNNCEGGFTYVHIYFRFIAAYPGIEIIDVVYDYNSEDREEINKIFPNPPLPCAPGANDAAKGNCTAIDTAIGTINTTPQGFLTSLFSTVLSIAGVGAIIIIIYGGYLFMTSQGNKEKIAGARETITAAVLGLLFIIFSIVLLKIIGVDILRIPGFK